MRISLATLLVFLLVLPAAAELRSCVTCCVEQQKIHTEPCEFSTVRDGNTYFFCQQGCLDRFAEEPEEWLQKYHALVSAQASKATELPEFKLPLEPAGSLRTDDVRGSVLVINLWASWCGPCMEEMPDLIRLQKELKSRGLVVLGLNFDKKRAAHQQAAQKLGLNFTSVFADQPEVQQLIDKIGPFPSIPVTLIVDRDGRIQHRLSGKQSYEDLLRLAEPLLPADKKTSKLDDTGGSFVPS